MEDYQKTVSNYKDQVTTLLCSVARGDNTADHLLASAIDNLNKSWNAWVDALYRRCNERDSQICRLMNELAEAKK